MPSLSLSTEHQLHHEQQSQQEQQQDVNFTKNQGFLRAEQEQEQQQQLSLYPRIISCIGGSIATSLVVQPLEVVKVRQQSYLTPALQQASSSTTSTFLCPQHGIVIQQQPPSTSSTALASTSVANSRPPGTFQMMNMIWKSEGLNGLYSGLRTGLIMYIPSTVLYYTAYEELASRMKQWNAHTQQQETKEYQIITMPSNFDTSVVPLVSGSLARVLATTVTSPLEFIRTRQAGGMNSSVLFPNDKSILQGIAHMYRGLVPTLWRDVPFSGFYWLGVETIRRQLVEYQTLYPNYVESLDRKVIHAGNSFVSGAIAGMFAAAITTPFDVVKTRYQMDLVVEGGSSSSSNSTGSTTTTSSNAASASSSSSKPSSAGRTTPKQKSLFGGHSNHHSCHHHQSSSIRMELACHTQASTSSATTHTGTARRHNQRPVIMKTISKGIKRLSSLSCICVEQYPNASQAGKGVWNQMTYIYQTEGIQGLWKGNVTRMIKVAPACAIMIASYEFGKSLLGVPTD